MLHCLEPKMLKIDFLQYKTKSICASIYVLLLQCHKKLTFSQPSPCFLVVLLYVCTHHFVIFDFQYFLYLWKVENLTLHIGRYSLKAKRKQEQAKLNC